MVEAAREPRLRRSWPQRFLITFNCILIATCVLGASAVGYSYYRFGNIPRLQLGGILADEAPGDPQNFLLVGSDTRAFVEGGDDAEYFGDEGDSGGQRADTMILVRVDPRAQTAAMVSFPRDLIVTVAGTGQRTRINEAFQGGPPRLIETIQLNFNIPVHHYVQVDFEGFQGLVDAVGGIDLYLPAPVRDRDANGNNVSGLDINQTGCVTLDGFEALSYVRSRHYEEFVDGRWRPDPTADVGRVQRQQKFIRQAVSEALAKGLTNPKKLADLIGVTENNLSFDEELDPRDILALGRRFQTLEPGAFQQFTLPTRMGRLGAREGVLFLDEERADEVLDVFRGVVTSEEVVQPSAVTVRVLNGSGRTGEAADAREALSAVGFNVPGSDDAGTTFAATTIRYASGERGKAELLAQHLPTPATLQEDAKLESVDVVLITGPDFTGILPTPRPVGAPPAAGAPPAVEAPPGGAPAAPQPEDPVEPRC